MLYNKLQRTSQKSAVCPFARTCHLKRQCEYKEYGFYLYQEESNPNQVVGIVDEGSSAEKSGLKVNDVILEVNEKDVRNKNHIEVVEMMKENLLEIKLLVVNREAKDFYEDQKRIKTENYLQSSESTSSCEYMLLNENTSY